MKNERERLIELVTKAKNFAINTIVHLDAEQKAVITYDSLVTDYLLENNVTVLPCKVGDTMFYVNNIFEEVLEAKLVSIEISSKKDSKVYATIEYEGHYMEKQILKAKLDELLNVCLFSTKEEAEQALKRR